jgi:hypothetical protein
MSTLGHESDVAPHRQALWPQEVHVDMTGRLHCELFGMDSCVAGNFNSYILE